MRRYQTDPSQLEGDDLDRWFRRSPAQVRADRETARQARYDAFFGAREGAPSSGPWEEDAPGSQNPTAGPGSNVIQFAYLPPVQAAPYGMRVAMPIPVGQTPPDAHGGGFFDTHTPIPNPIRGPAYITDLPSPLNLVTPRAGVWFELGDGRLVRSADEVERLFAEQQLRMTGEEKPEPPAQVRSMDQWKDGAIPSAEQVAAGQREIDPTCHVNGGWERDPTFSRYKAWTQDYEDQITRAPGLDYVVRNPEEKAVRFDGCAVWDPRRQLLEAKGPGYAGLDRRARKSNFAQFLWKGIHNQSQRQNRAARGRTVEWHIAEPEVVPAFRTALETPSTLRVIQTSPRTGAPPPPRK
jgi:hypothetical protein